MTSAANGWNVGRRKGVVVICGADGIARQALRARLERLSPEFEFFMGERAAAAPALLRKVPARPALVLVDGEGTSQAELHRVLRVVHRQLATTRVPLVLLCEERDDTFESVHLSTQIVRKPLCERKTMRLAESYLRPWLLPARPLAAAG